MGRKIDKAWVQLALMQLGQAVERPGTLYLTGEVAMLWQGEADSARQIDVAMAPEPGGVFGAISQLKCHLDIDIELVDLGKSVPTLPGWQGRSSCIGRFGHIDTYLYDFYGQALAAVYRDHEGDREHIARMIADGRVRAEEWRRLCASVGKSTHHRYPHLDWPALVASVDQAVGKEDDLSRYPGGHHLREGLRSLQAATTQEDLSESAALLLLARPKLVRLGLDIPQRPPWLAISALELLYQKVESKQRPEQASHAAAQALRDEIVSFANAYSQLGARAS